MTQIRASIYGLVEPSRRVTVRELWTEMAQDIVQEFNDCYLYSGGLGYRIVICESPSVSPDKSLARYRTIEAGIRRKSGRRTLLDLSLGNLFCRADSEPTERLHVVNDPRYSVWARNAGKISLVEHVQLIERFVEHVMDAGWMLEKPELKQAQILPPLVRNDRRECLLPTKGFSQLARYPAVDVATDTEFVLVGANTQVSERAAKSLKQAFSSCFQGSSASVRNVACSQSIVHTAVNLILLADNEELSENYLLRDMLRRAEGDGCKFKLAKAASLSKPYPAQNIAYDMFQLAGGKPWVPVHSQPAFSSIDAGHSVEQHKSRWVKVETDRQQRIVDVRVVLTPLAEHVPNECISDLWPTQEDAIACRDGRLSQERDSMENRAATEGRPLIESKKSPKAILWRLDGNEVKPAEFGDSILDEHGDLLLQTVSQDERDYIHPVRLSASNGSIEDLATAFLHQHAMPGLSLFRMSRLPGTLYFADLISKMSADGWPKVIGRGLRLQSNVP